MEGGAVEVIRAREAGVNDPKRSSVAGTVLDAGLVYELLGCQGQGQS